MSRLRLVVAPPVPPAVADHCHGIGGVATAACLAARLVLLASARASREIPSGPVALPRCQVAVASLSSSSVNGRHRCCLQALLRGARMSWRRAAVLLCGVRRKMPSKCRRSLSLPVAVVQETVLPSLPAAVVVQCSLGPPVHLTGAEHVGLLPCSLLLLAGSTYCFPCCSCCSPLLPHSLCCSPLCLELLVAPPGLGDDCRNVCQVSMRVPRSRRRALGDDFRTPLRIPAALVLGWRRHLRPHRVVI